MIGYEPVNNDAEIYLVQLARGTELIAIILGTVYR